MSEEAGTERYHAWFSHDCASRFWGTITPCYAEWEKEDGTKVLVTNVVTYDEHDPEPKTAVQWSDLVYLGVVTKYVRSFHEPLPKKSVP